jgi:hypothetical protein
MEERILAAGEILGDGNLAEEGTQQKDERHEQKDAHLKGFPSLHFLRIPFPKPQRGSNEGFGAPGHALDYSCVRACALVASQLPQGNVTPGGLPA